MNVTSTIRTLLTISAIVAGSATLVLAADEKQSAPHPFGRESAQADMQKLTAGKGLEATLFASEPMLVNPCDMDVDSRGRVWITEGANYRSSFQKWGVLRPEGDRIVVLEDKNGDGRADNVTT